MLVLLAVTVAVSVLIGVELLGFLGALAAIPVAGSIQVIARDVCDERRMRWKGPIAVGVGADEVARAEAGGRVAEAWTEVPSATWTRSRWWRRSTRRWPRRTSGGWRSSSTSRW